MYTPADLQTTRFECGVNRNPANTSDSYVMPVAFDIFGKPEDDDLLLTLTG